MSKLMLNDEDAMDKVNPFVTQDLSLPGGVRQTGNFDDFVEVKPKPPPAEVKSVFCDTGLCADEEKPHLVAKTIHPRRNIDCGYPSKKKEKEVIIGVSNKSIPYGWIFLAILILTLVLLYVRR